MDQVPSPIEPPATPASETGMRILRPLRIRDFALLFGGTTVSLFGDGIYIVALAWQVYDLSNVPTALSAVGVAWTLPMVIFLLIGGVLGDRFDRRKLMIAGDAIRAVAIAAIAVLALSGVIELWHLIAFTVLYGVGDAIFAPNFQAVVPDVVPQRLLVEANSLQQLAEPVAFRFAGPAIGGLLVAGARLRRRLRGRRVHVPGVDGVRGPDEAVAGGARGFRRHRSRGHPRGGAVRPLAAVAVGDAALRRGHAAPVPGAVRGAAPVHRPQRAGRRRRVSSA